MGKTIKGDSRHYIVVNTSEYNGDGVWEVSDYSYSEELRSLGFTEEDYRRFGKLRIGEVLSDFYEHGVYVMRVA